MVTHKLTPPPPGRPRSNSVLTSYETTFQAPVLEERRRALNNWLLNRKADNRSEDEQIILEIFHAALRSRITGELSALQELATNKIAGSSKTTSSIASNVAATAIDILMSLITVIPVTGNVAIAVGGAITQQQSKNKAEASSEKLGDNDDLRRIIQDFSARVVAYYQHEITQLQVKAEAAGSPSIARVFSNYVLSKETTILSESHRELIEYIVERFLQHLKTLDIKRIPLADMGAHLARPILLISRQQPVFSPELVIDDTIRINNAYHLIRLAQLAALPQSKKEEMAKLWGYNEPENLAEIGSIEETSAVVLANPQHLLVSFARPDNKWLSIFENSRLISHSSGIGQIHEGYYETFLKIWNEIKLNILSYLEQRRLHGQIPEIYFTGHELGGAFATFAAAELLLLQPDVKVHLYTFGQPRVGDLQFREFLERNNVDYQRWIFSDGPMVNRVTKSGYVDMGMTLELPTVSLKPHQQAFSISQYHDGLFLYAQERDVTLLIETEESEFEQRSKEAAAEILALKRRVQEQNFRAHETEGLFVGHDEARVEHLGRLISEPIAPATIEITAPTPTRDALQLIQHIHSLLNNSGEEAYKELPLRSQELQELSFNIALIGTPYATTEALEQVLVHRRFEFLPADAKYALLLSYEHFLWLSFIRSKGHGYIPPPADLNGKLKQIWLDEKNNSGIYFQFMKISAILIILQEQKKVKDNGFAQLIIRLFAEIQISYAHPSESITVLEEIWSLLRKHPLIPPDYRDILFFTFLNQIQRPSVELIQWIQGKLWYYLENTANEWTSALSIAGLEFLIKQLQDAPNFVCEMIIVGDKNAIGVRHWLDNRLPMPPKEQEWPLEHYLQSKLTILSTHSEPLIQGLVTAHKLNSETELGRLGTLLTTLSQIASLTPEQKFRYLLLRHHLHNILGKKPNVNDYINLANAAENIHRNLAKRSYIRAQGLLQKNKDPTLWKQMQQGLSRIYLAEADECRDKIPRIKMYTAALEADPENQAALEKLFTATLAPSLFAITLRLASIGRLIPADQKQSAIDNGEVIISGPFSGVYVLNPQALRQLFAGKELRAANVYDDHGVTRQEGQHVVAVVGEAPNQIHLKKNAGSTGLSLAAQAFYHVMFGLTDLIPPGLVPVEPLKIERKNQEPIYVQASPTVYGESLKQYLTKPAPALKDKDFDPLQWGALVIASLFLDPEDGRPPNWLVTLMDGVLHLMSVDNDHVWVRESIMKLRTLWGDSVNRPLVKNVLYCFPQMLEKVPHALRDILLSQEFSPITLLKTWLQTLRFYNQAVRQNYSEDELKQLYERPNETEQMIVEAFFDSEQMGKIYVKLGKLRKALQSETATLMDVLTAIQPELGKLHEDSFTQDPKLSPKERFEKLTDGLFTHQGGTKATNADIPRFVLGKRPKTYAEFKAMSKMPEDLLIVLEDIHHDDQLVKLIINDMKAGRISMFRMFPELQNSVLSQFSFGDMADGVYTAELHQEVIAAIGSEIETLVLRDNPRVTDTEVVQLIERQKGLKGVRILNCNNVIGKPINVSIFSSETQSIVKVCADRKVNCIDFGSCSNLQPVIFDELEQLYKGKSADIIITSNKYITEWKIQRISCRHPQWGLPMRTAIKMEPTKVDNSRLFPHYRNPVTSGQWDKDNIFVMQFLHAGYLVAGFKDGSIRLVDLNTGEEFKMGGHWGAVNSICVMSRSRFISGSEDGTIKVWDLLTRNCVLTMTEPSEDIEFVPKYYTLREYPEFLYAPHLHTPIFYRLDEDRFLRRTKKNNYRLWNIKDKKFSTVSRFKDFRDYDYCENEIVCSNISLYRYIDSFQKQNTVENYDDEVRIERGFNNLFLFYNKYINDFFAGSIITKFNPMNMWSEYKEEQNRMFNAYNHGSKETPFGNPFTRFESSVLPATDTKIFSYNSFELETDGFFFVGRHDADFMLLHINNGFEALPSVLETYSARLMHNFMQLLLFNKLNLNDVPMLLKPNLKFLDVSDTPFNDSLAKAVLAHCPKLHTLKHDNCTFLTESGKKMIAEELAKRNQVAVAVSGSPVFVPT